MIRFPSLAALLLVAACSPERQAAPVTNQASSEAEAPAADSAVPALEGQWRVAAIDGKPVDAASAMTASFAGGKLSISAGCLRRAWAYTQKRNVVAFTANPGGSSNCGGQSPNAVQEAAYDVVTQANIAIFDKGGSEASLSGTGGNLTLQRS